MREPTSYVDISVLKLYVGLSQKSEATQFLLACYSMDTTCDVVTPTSSLLEAYLIVMARDKTLQSVLLLLHWKHDTCTQSERLISTNL